MPLRRGNTSFPCNRNDTYDTQFTCAPGDLVEKIFRVELVRLVELAHVRLTVLEDLRLRLVRGGRL